MATASQQQNRRQAMVSYSIREAGPGILILVLTLVFMVGIFMVPPWYITQDLQGSQPRQGIGKVTGVYYHKQSAPTVTLEVNGARVSLQTTQPVRIGQEVTVTYRVGKSGTVYAQNIDSPF
jgi:hypothetical protein